MTTEPDDNDIFDSIVSGERNAEIAQTSPEQAPPQEQVRDEAGKFAKAEATQQPPAENEPPVQTPVALTPEGVPVAAVQDERRKRQEAERRAEELERRLAALETRATAAPVPIAQTETPATIWDDPDAYIQGQLSPVQQAIAEMRDMQMESRAEGLHGAEKLAAAKAAAEKLFGTPEGVALHRELNAKGNPYSNLVAWHERQQTLETVGNDPQAWLQSEIDKKLADPEFLAQAIERARSGVAPVAPGRTNAPLVNLPPSLSKLPAGGNIAQTADQTDSGMFAAITSARRT